MNTEFEEEFVRNYFDKRCRERILHELSSPKKRKEFFHRMAHTCEEYIKQDTVKRKSKMPIAKSELYNIFGSGKCYVIAEYSEYDGQLVDCKEALEELWAVASPYVMIAESGDTVYLETEYNFSQHWSYILGK